MAILDILHYPDPRLRNTAAPVDIFDARLCQFVDDMFETMYGAPGIGLAAIQVNEPKRVIVLDISEDQSEPHCFINPYLLSAEGEVQMEEGCLSVPGIYEIVQRPEFIRVQAQDRNGESFSLDAEGMLAVCIQHEIDHLDGKLFVDYLSRLKRQRIKKKAEKSQR